MVFRSPDFINQNRNVQAGASPFLLSLRPKPEVLPFDSNLNPGGAARLQTFLTDTALPSFADPQACFSNCGLQQEAIPALDRFAKRVLDLVISSAALVLVWPLMLLIAVAVKLESRGPAIYASVRVGKRGVPFVCYKFRTMIPGANQFRKVLHHLNERNGPFFKIANDPRVTSLGRFLRKYSLDELPQFWNVLKGNMSLVGPRPHPLEDVALYSAGHEQRLEVTPGMTGLWQVTARENPSFETCMKMDVSYIRNWSLLLDFKILLQTIPAVLAGEGQ